MYRVISLQKLQPGVTLQLLYGTDRQIALWVRHHSHAAGRIDEDMVTAAGSIMHPSVLRQDANDFSRVHGSKPFWAIFWSIYWARLRVCMYTHREENASPKYVLVDALRCKRPAS